MGCGASGQAASVWRAGADAGTLSGAQAAGGERAVWWLFLAVTNALRVSAPAQTLWYRFLLVWVELEGAPYMVGLSSSSSFQPCMSGTPWTDGATSIGTASREFADP